MTGRRCTKHALCVRHQKATSECYYRPFKQPADTSATNCDRCGTWVQGGDEGMAAHNRTVHPKRPTRDPRGGPPAGGGERRTG